jgi:hypothetical protein
MKRWTELVSCRMLHFNVLWNIRNSYRFLLDSEKDYVPFNLKDNLVGSLLFCLDALKGLNAKALSVNKNNNKL